MMALEPSAWLSDKKHILELPQGNGVVDLKAVCFIRSPFVVFSDLSRKHLTLLEKGVGGAKEK